MSNFQHRTHVPVPVITLWKREKMYAVTYSLSNTAILKTWLHYTAK